MNISNNTATIIIKKLIAGTNSSYLSKSLGYKFNKIDRWASGTHKMNKFSRILFAQNLS